MSVAAVSHEPLQRDRKSFHGGGESDLQLMLLQADPVGGGGHGPMGPEVCKL